MQYINVINDNIVIDLPKHHTIDMFNERNNSY